MSGLTILFDDSKPKLLNIVPLNDRSYVLKAYIVNEYLNDYLKKCFKVVSSDVINNKVSCLNVNYDLDFKLNFLEDLIRLNNLALKKPMPERISYLVDTINDKVVSEFNDCSLVGIEVYGDNFINTKLDFNLNVGMVDGAVLNFMKTVILKNDDVVYVHTKLPRIY